MAKFRFVGDPNEEGGRTDTIYHGYVFADGEPVEVADSTLAARLRKHSHFEEVKSSKKAKKKDAE